MWRLAIAAVAAALFAQPVGAQSDLSEARKRICDTYGRIDIKKGLECHEQLLRDAERELDRLLLEKARDEVVFAFIARYGIDQPDVQAKIEVARRHGVLWAVILDDCWYSTDRVDDLEHCLDQREKAETWLGNAMDEPQ